LAYPQAYIDYLVHFHATRDYFECHEQLEDYWKTLPKDDPAGVLWVGLIQLAVAQYHYRRCNFAGARKMLAAAASRLKPERLGELGLNGSALAALVEEQRTALHAEPAPRPFADLALPIVDSSLLGTCLARSAQLGAKWGSASRLEDEALVHRHSRRDRSEVVQARIRSLAAKKRTTS